jgi:GAF domain-containing protein
LLRARLHLSELAQHASSDELVRSALDEAEALTGSCIGFFHLVDEDQENLTLLAWSTSTLRDMCQAEGKGRHYPIIEAGAWVDCFHARRPVIHNDHAALAHKKGLPEGHAPIVRDLAVPILRGDRVVAIMGVGNKAGDYTQADVDVLQSFAVPLMDLLEYQRAEEALRELNATLEQHVAQRTAELSQRAEQLRALALELTQAEQRERRRLAQVLHDHLQQLLVAARMKVGLLRRRVQDDQLGATIGQLDDLLNETIKESRSLAVQLFPPVLYTEGLAAGLQWLAHRTREKFDLAIEVQADPAAEPAEETTRAFLFQAVGELLLNAAKHARARRVQVRMNRVVVQSSRLPPGEHAPLPACQPVPQETRVGKPPVAPYAVNPFFC